MTNHVISILAFLFLISNAKAEVPQLINYQGSLTDRDGNPVDATVSIQFEIYNQAAGGNVLWSETQSVTVVDGIFSVLLGSVSTIPYSVFNGQDRYLALQVGNDSEMTPRKRLVSVGYAFLGNNSDKLDGKHDSSFVQSVDGVHPDKNGNIDLEAGNNVSVTSDNSTHKITISATPGGGGDNLGDHTATQHIKLNGHWLSGDGDAEGVYVKSNGQVGIGTRDSSAQLYVLTASKLAVAGTATGAFGKGVVGAGVTGVEGIGHNYGVFGWSPNLWALYGETKSGVGVAGYHSDNRTYGALGLLNSGAYGLYDNGNYGRLGAESWGVYGYGGVGPNMTYGSNHQQDNSANGGYGVYGEHSNGKFGYLGGESHAVYGQNGSFSGYLGGGGAGVCGRKGNNVGYIGYGNYAGYFDGDVHVTGTFTAGGHKSFKTDHPLDPANKYLYHYCLESDELSNVYSGNVILDANGEATVELPDWFEALNKNFRYQLTCIGGFAQVYIAEEINNNQFKIAGGRSGMKVSWLITGIRTDAFAKAHPAQVEVEKKRTERGKYLHPVEHGMPETMGINYEERSRIEEHDRKMNEERKYFTEKVRRMEEENERIRER